MLIYRQYFAKKPSEMWKQKGGYVTVSITVTAPKDGRTKAWTSGQ